MTKLCDLQKTIQSIDILNKGKALLKDESAQLGLDFTTQEIDHIYNSFIYLNKNPSSTELKLLHQLQSSHNTTATLTTKWTIDGTTQQNTITDIINSTAHNLQSDSIQANLYKDSINITTNKIAAFCHLATAHLQIPELKQPWTDQTSKLNSMPTPLDIIQATTKTISLNNKLNIPSIAGFFRTFELSIPQTVGHITRSYYKPLQLTGYIESNNTQKNNTKNIQVGDKIIILEDNPPPNDKERSTNLKAIHETINYCKSLGSNNPISSTYEINSTSLSVAVIHLLEESNYGANLQLHSTTSKNAEDTCCNQIADNILLTIKPNQLDEFNKICNRKLCPNTHIGEIIKKKTITITDTSNEDTPIVDLPVQLLKIKSPPPEQNTSHTLPYRHPFDHADIPLPEAISRVLQFPAVANKSFLITTADRTAGGLVARDQMVGPWQIPVSNVAATCTNFQDKAGYAFAIGERLPTALLHPAASARLALGEALTNISAAYIKNISDITLNLSFSGSHDYSSDCVGVFDGMQTIGMELCPALGISISNFHESLSMKTTWQDKTGNTHTTSPPLSVVVTASANIGDTNKILTPNMDLTHKTKLLFIDLANKSQCLGGSALTQAYQKLGQRPADLDSAQTMRDFLVAMQEIHEKSLAIAYHDRSDGGLLTTLLEMSFASQSGLEIDITSLGSEPIPILFNEELGVVLQVEEDNLVRVKAILQNHNLLNNSYNLGTPTNTNLVKIMHNDKCIYSNERSKLQQLWSKTSYHMQALHGNQECAKQQFDEILNPNNKGISDHINFEIQENTETTYANTCKPKIAMLRDIGSHGHHEMAAAFNMAGFDCIDLHMSDLKQQHKNLNDYIGLVVCDIHDSSILSTPTLKEMFYNFFNREDTFTLGVSNGCQLLTSLKSIIPGSSSWPNWQTNKSMLFESRFTLVKINSSPSIFLKGMTDSIIPIPIATATGNAVFEHTKSNSCLQYVDSEHNIATIYPHNPSGSTNGIAGVTSNDGRVTLIMPHPERAFLSKQMSWNPRHYCGTTTPWLQLFKNARSWVD